MRFINLSSCSFYVVSVKKLWNVTLLGIKTYTLVSILKELNDSFVANRPSALCKFDAINQGWGIVNVRPYVAS